MKLLLEETGQGMAEYGLILAFVAMVVVTALGVMGGAIQDFYQSFIGMM